MEGQGHFLKLVPVHLHMKIKTCISKKLQGHFIYQNLYVSFQQQGNETPLT